MQSDFSRTSGYCAILFLSFMVICSEGDEKPPSLNDFGIFIPDIIITETPVEKTLAEPNYLSQKIMLTTDYSLSGSAEPPSLRYPRIGYNLFNVSKSAIESTDDELIHFMPDYSGCNTESGNAGALTILNYWQGKACNPADLLVMFCQPGQKKAQCRMAPDSLLFSTEFVVASYNKTSNAASLKLAETAPEERKNAFQGSCLFMIFTVQKFILASALHLSDGVSENHIQCYANPYEYGRQKIIALDFTYGNDWQPDTGVMAGKAVESVKIFCPKTNSPETCQLVDGTGNGDESSQNGGGNKNTGNQNGNDARKQEETRKDGNARTQEDHTSSRDEGKDDKGNSGRKNNKEGGQNSASEGAEKQGKLKIDKEKINWFVGQLKYLLNNNNAWAQGIIKRWIQILKGLKKSGKTSSTAHVDRMIGHMENLLAGVGLNDDSIAGILESAYVIISEPDQVELYQYAQNSYDLPRSYEESTLAQQLGFLPDSGQGSPASSTDRSLMSLRRLRRQPSADIEGAATVVSEEATEPITSSTRISERSLLIRGFRKVAKRVGELADKRLSGAGEGEGGTAVAVYRKFKKAADSAERKTRRPGDSNMSSAANEVLRGGAFNPSYYEVPSSNLAGQNGAESGNQHPNADPNGVYDDVESDNQHSGTGVDYITYGNVDFPGQGPDKADTHWSGDQPALDPAVPVSEISNYLHQASPDELKLETDIYETVDEELSQAAGAPAQPVPTVLEYEDSCVDHLPATLQGGDTSEGSCELTEEEEMSWRNSAPLDIIQEASQEGDQTLSSSPLSLSIPTSIESASSSELPSSPEAPVTNQVMIENSETVQDEQQVPHM